VQPISTDINVICVCACVCVYVCVLIVFIYFFLNVGATIWWWNKDVYIYIAYLHFLQINFFFSVTHTLKNFEGARGRLCSSKGRLCHGTMAQWPVQACV